MLSHEWFAGRVSATAAALSGSNPKAPGSAGGYLLAHSFKLFRALEQQLGLRLVKVKAVPVDIIVIDHAEMSPVED